MPSVARSGRARISTRHPRAMGECDRCGFWHNHADMVRQFQYAGNKLIDTGLLVGRDCLDKPLDQLRSIILPPDPRPIFNARPSPNVTPYGLTGQIPPVSPGNLGFTQYVLGASVPPLYPSTMASVLTNVIANSAIAVPAGLAGYAINMPQNTTTTILSANTQRTYLLLFNPTQSIVQVATGTATLGLITNISIGPGEAYFWATSQWLGTVYQGAMTAISPWGGSLPLWIWEDGILGLTNDGGVLVVDGNVAPGWPAVQPAGPGVWSNGGVASVGAGAVFDPTSTPLFFGSVTASELLTVGGNYLPQTQPAVGSLQLWNPGGIIGGDIWVA